MGRRLDAMSKLEDAIQVVNQLNADDRARLRQYLDNDTQETISHPSTRRIAGLHEHLGHAWVSDDFDDPLPDSFWLGSDA
jgi:hypothetical protein